LLASDALTTAVPFGGAVKFGLCVERVG